MNDIMIPVPRMPPRLSAFALRLAGLAIFLCPGSLYALSFTTGRAGAAWSYLVGDKGANSSTASLNATGRIGYRSDDYRTFIAIDVNAFRILKNSSLKTNYDGNCALLAAGYEFLNGNIWLAGGAGELRGYDRTEEKTRPYGYYVIEQQLGGSYTIYNSDYAKVELGAAWDRLRPDADWRGRTQVRNIESLQFEIGFRLLNW